MKLLHSASGRREEPERTAWYLLNTRDRKGWGWGSCETRRQPPPQKKTRSTPPSPILPPLYSSSRPLASLLLRHFLGGHLGGLANLSGSSGFRGWGFVPDLPRLESAGTGLPLGRSAKVAGGRHSLIAAPA